MRRATALVLSTAAAVPLLAACGTGGGDPASAPATSETTTSQEPASHASTTDDPADDPAEDPADDPADGEPAFPENTAAQTAGPSGEWDLVLTAIRVGDHEDFQRIVLEFAGTGTPGWAVDYVDEAVLDGSGETVTLGGDSVLDIYASGTTSPKAEGDYYRGPRQFEPTHGGDINDVYVVGGTFEGSTQVIAGIDGHPVPFRVFALTDPSRLVVDVVDEGAD